MTKNETQLCDLLQTVAPYFVHEKVPLTPDGEPQPKWWDKIATMTLQFAHEKRLTVERRQWRGIMALTLGDATVVTEFRRFDSVINVRRFHAGELEDIVKKSQSDTWRELMRRQEREALEGLAGPRSIDDPLSEREKHAAAEWNKAVR